jgi:23S rRNA pseudouridine2457 synthase
MNDAVHRYFIIHKPYNMVSQFVSSHPVRLLGDLDFLFPEGSHAIGRLDTNSEGLLIITTDKSVTRKLFQGEVKHERKYLVQVKKVITNEAIEKLKTGVPIRVEGGGYFITTPCKVELVTDPYRYIQKPADHIDRGDRSWIMISLTEGKFRQVRKMVAAVGHRCVRLIRVGIEDLSLIGLATGEVKELDRREFFRQLKIND